MRDLLPDHLKRLTGRRSVTTSQTAEVRELKYSPETAVAFPCALAVLSHSLPTSVQARETSTVLKLRGDTFHQHCQEAYQMFIGVLRSGELDKEFEFRDEVRSNSSNGWLR